PWYSVRYGHSSRIFGSFEQVTEGVCRPSYRTDWLHPLFEYIGFDWKRPHFIAQLGKARLIRNAPVPYTICRQSSSGRTASAVPLVRPRPVYSLGVPQVRG